MVHGKGRVFIVDQVVAVSPKSQLEHAGAAAYRSRRADFGIDPHSDFFQPSHPGSRIVAGVLNVLKTLQSFPDVLTHCSTAFDTCHLATLKVYLDPLGDIAGLLAHHHTVGIGYAIQLGLELHTGVVGNGSLQRHFAVSRHSAGFFQAFQIGLVNRKADVRSSRIGNAELPAIDQSVPGLHGDQFQELIRVAHGRRSQLLGPGKVQPGRSDRSIPANFSVLGSPSHKTQHHVVVLNHTGKPVGNSARHDAAIG